jgi:hypothetical protein
MNVWRKRGWLVIGAILGLCGCEPAARVDLTVHSTHDVEAKVSATVATSDRDLTKATMKRVLPGDWRLSEVEHGSMVTITMVQNIDPLYSDGLLEVTQHSAGPLRLRRAWDIKANLQIKNLPAEHPLAVALANVPVTVALRAPGRLAAPAGGTRLAGGEIAQWDTTLGKMIGQPLALADQARAWRVDLLVLLLILAVIVLYVLWPLISPPEPLRSQRRAAAAQRRAVAAQRRAAADVKRRDAAAQKSARDAVKAEKARAAAERKRLAQEAAAEKAAKAADAAAKAEPPTAAEPEAEPDAQGGDPAMAERARKSVARRRWGKR